MFEVVLVAARGEIAVRVIQTLRRLGVSPVAVYSDADAGAPHTRAADIAIRLGPAPAADSYLRVDRVLEAAARAGAQAVHPGYGFLSESPAFARACAAAGLAFIGPPAEAIAAMGDKIRAKQLMAQAGVPVVPGTSGGDLVAAARDIGLPLLVKPAAGGGGKGMRLVRRLEELADALASARREAVAAFGDGTLLLERFIEQARHIEIQLLADMHGNVVHLGERECSLQRRHQKIVEEAPSPLVGRALRERLGASAIAAARACGYVSAGTVEFVVSATDPDEFFFLEMNTRLQVEHPVTELVTGLDLVAWQVRIAAGQPLGFAQDEVRIHGHAIEARVYAEDPCYGFLPTGGEVLRLRQPSADGVRVDSGVAEGLTVGTHYDPMLAKVIAWGEDRRVALRRLDRALAGFTLLGFPVNIGFLRRLLMDPEVVAGRLHTGLVEERLAGFVNPSVPLDVLAVGALAHLLRRERAGAAGSMFDMPGGWRIGEPAWQRLLLRAGEHEAVDVRVRGRAARAEITIGEHAPISGRAAWTRDGGIEATLAGVTREYAYAHTAEVTWLGRDGAAWAVREQQPLATARPDAAPSGHLVSPMPGTVTAVRAAVGDEVTTGQTLVVVEAMKMEHPVTAPTDGVVAQLLVRTGQQVALGEPLVVVEAQASPT